MPLPVFIKKENKVFVNPAKKYVRPFWLATDPKEITLLANGTSDPIPMLIDQTGHFEIAYALSQSTGAYKVEIFDAGRQYKWMNKPIHIDLIAGTAQRPFIFPESYFLNVANGQRTLVAKFTDISGAGNSIRFSLHGRRFLYNEAPAEIYTKMSEYFQLKERTNLFFLTTEDLTTGLAGLATQNTEFRVTSDAYFEVLKMTAVEAPVSPATFTGYEVTLEEYATGRKLMNDAIRGDQVFGTAQYPFIPFESYLLERDYRIKMALKNLNPNAGQTCDYHFCFVGRRIPLPEQVAR